MTEIFYKTFISAIAVVHIITNAAVIYIGVVLVNMLYHWLVKADDRYVLGYLSSEIMLSIFLVNKG